MTGIAEMFAELSGVDEFSYAFAAEGESRAQHEKVREYRRTSWRRIKATPARIEKRRAYMRSYMKEYDKRRRQEDPAYLEMRRRTARESMRRRYAAQKAARAA